MKIRAGFVSNSSSSSFCIFGTEVDIDAIAEANGISDYDFEKKIEEAGLSIHYYYDTRYIGREFSTIKDDETGAQFKQSVRDALAAFKGFENAELAAHEESYYNG